MILFYTHLSEYLTYISFGKILSFGSTLFSFLTVQTVTVVFLKVLFQKYILLLMVFVLVFCLVFDPYLQMLCSIYFPIRWIIIS